MVWSRNPLVIIAETLAIAPDDTQVAAEEVIKALENEGWHFAWSGSPERGEG